MSPGAEQICDDVPGPPHRVLSIQEILEEIFQWLSPRQLRWHPASRMIKTLYRAALVCTAFQGPALDVLWRDLESVRPLLKIMEIYGSDGDDKPLLVPLAPHGWSRFLVYSSRIHTLSFELGNREKDEGLIKSVATELSSHAPRAPAFPCLASLRWNRVGYLCMESLDEALATTFLSHCPALRRFEMIPNHGSTTTAFLGTILRKLHATVPMLQELSLQEFSEASIRENYSLLAGFQALRSLECPVVSLPMLRFCAERDLAEFKLALTMPLTNESGHVCLRTVRSLRVEASIETILRFLGAVTYPLLTSLDLCLSEYVHDWTRFPRHLKAFSTMFAPYQALRTLRIVCGIYGDGDFPLVELVAPLLELRQLEEVAIDTGLTSQHMSLDDDGLYKLASSWPCLKALEIGPKMERGEHEPSIPALAAFARFCPNLRSLTLSSIVVPSDLGPVLAVCHSLRYLLIWFHRLPKDSSTVARPIQVAHFLHKMFPNVARIEDDGYDECGWAEVNGVWAKLRAGQDVKELEGKYAEYRDEGVCTDGGIKNSKISIQV
ncbi:hypothetical protein B0H21DRAFT_824829 [Amylocystis lapponica]|nr:hypothetical protein B0H21DRAFT_824829 [Amylocystis lapponica]